jgi:hypothetical protein
MTARFKEYTIDIVDEPNFSLGSADNVFIYDMVYCDYTEQATSKHGIKVGINGQTIRSVLICETGGATGVYGNSFIIADDVLLICCADTVYSFGLPTLSLNWKNRFDLATCFAIYPFREDVIIHGELSVKRIDLNGNVKWNFSAKDIFVTLDGTDAIKFTDDKIEVKDWNGDKYILDDNGQLIG